MTELTLELAKQLTQEAESTDFTVDFDELWQWCGYTRKDNAKKVLEKNFNKGLDYEERFLHFEEWASAGGSSNQPPNRTIKLYTTPDCAKEFGMLARTEQGRTVRQYFIKAEKELRAIQANLTPAELVLQQAQRLVDQERKQRELEKEFKIFYLT